MCRQLWALCYLPGPSSRLGSHLRAKVVAGIVFENAFGQLGDMGGTDVGGLASPLFASLQPLTYLAGGAPVKGKEADELIHFTDIRHDWDVCVCVCVCVCVLEKSCQGQSAPFS